MHVVVDTDFLSAMIKIERMELIYRVFGVDRIFITQAVLDELAKAPFFDKVKEQLKRIELAIVDKLPENKLSAMLGKGEFESITFAMDTDSVLLTNDKKAGEYAESLGIKVLDIISFLLVCKEKNIVTVNDLKCIIDDVKKYDYMEFDQEHKRLLFD